MKNSQNCLIDVSLSYWENGCKLLLWLIYELLYILYSNIRIIMIHKKYSPRVQKTLKTLGQNINIARRRRRESQQQFAERMGISSGTLKRLEKGDPGIGIGHLAMAFLALGELHRLDNILDCSTDELGLMIDLEALPKRIRTLRKPPSEVTTPNMVKIDRLPPPNPEGVAF